jgi:hypothetical protein
MPNPFIKATNLFSYQNTALQERALIATASNGTGVNSLNNNVGYWDASGNFVSIFTPSLNASAAVRATNSRDWEFFADGIASDLKAWNISKGTSNWGIAAPTSAPGVAATSGTNATWVANTVFSTMGILADQNGFIQQLVSVNAGPISSNTTTGTTGVGQPQWNQTSGGTTADAPITWTNRGPIGLWKPNTFYSEGHFGTGTLASPAILYDPTTQALYFNNQGGGGVSGATKPSFNAKVGTITLDGDGSTGNVIRWEFLGPVKTTTTQSTLGVITQWLASHVYGTWGATNNFTTSAVVEPCGPVESYDPIAGAFSTTIYLQSATVGGTSPSSEANPFFSQVKGDLTDDYQLQWRNMGSAAWPQNTAVTAWQPGSKIFSAIKDSNNNIQICVVSGTTGNSAPTWATQYGAATNDGSTVVWACVGSSLSWAANTFWFLPANGFTAPQTTSSYGGASIIDSSNNLESCINSGKSGSSAPTWASVGFNTADGGTALVLTQVAVAGSTTTYTGTITGGAGNALAGQNFLIAGFTNSVNNVLIQVTSSTATTLVCTTNTPPQVNETHAGTATSGLIWFDLQATVVGQSGSVSLITPVGRRYYLSYLNSAKQNFSDLSPISNGTGPLTNAQITLFNLAVSPDPQVDQKVILATSDGGSPTTLYLVATIANTTTSYTDNVAQSNLVLGNIYQQNDAAGNPVGVLFNQPPPNGSFPTLHKGRVFMIVNNALAYSKSIYEVTTSSGIIAGRFEENWPPGNVINYSPGIEVGKGLLSDGTALYIGTEQHIRRVLGDGTPQLGFQTPDVLFSAVGLMTQNVWQVVFLEGTPVGAMWVTPDFRVIGSDFNTYKDVGTAIQTTLNNINPAAVNNAWAQSITLGPYNFYALAIPTGTNTTPDTMCVYEMHLKKWFIWQFADNFISGLFYISLNGTPRWLMVDANGNIRVIDQAGVVDRATDVSGPVSITSTFRTTWLNLGDASTRKTLNEIELGTSATGMLVTIEGATNQAEFTSPNVIASNLPLTQNIFGQLKVFLSGFQSIYRYYRFTFSTTSSASTSLPSDVLLGYFSAEVFPLNRI